MKIGPREIGEGYPAYVIAEMSANHNGNFQKAVQMVHAAKEAGADAIKIQTYTADTITLRSDKKYFKIESGTIWDGATLHDLYQKACTPWEWQPRLKEIADGIGLELFSSPFDFTAVDFLEKMKVRAYKIASFECIDLPLIEKAARTGKPVILSTGMASLEEITEAVETVRKAGGRELALMKCTSDYPADPADIHLKTIAHLSQTFDLPVGFSDHTQGTAVAIAAVVSGAALIEKHFTLSRRDRSPDSEFSLEPEELKTMIQGIRAAEKALGPVHYGLTQGEEKSRIFRRSLFVVAPVKKGEKFSEKNIRSIRPGYGLPPKYYRQVLGASAAMDIDEGTPLERRHIEGGAI